MIHIQEGMRIRHEKTRYLALSVKYLEFIALFQQPFYGPGQGVFHVFSALMESWKVMMEPFRT